MAKLKNIRYLLKSALKQLEAYGQKKHADKLKTYEDRKVLKQHGFTQAEREKEANYMKDKIYSMKTMETYQREVSKFADWLNENGMGKITLEQAALQIQPYMDYLRDKGMAASSVHTALAACCKTTHTYMRDYNIPERKLADMKRGKHEVRNDRYNERNHAEILAVNRVIGVRRSELMNIRVKDVTEIDGVMRIYTKGKGGKDNHQIITEEADKSVIRPYLEGKADHERLFPREMFRNDADLHSARADRAKIVYQRVVEDMEKHPERREYYKDFIRKEFENRGKKLPKNLDHAYVCRGSFRQMLIAEGKAVSYDRAAAMYVSLTVTNHWRVDTTIEHYLTK